MQDSEERQQQTKEHAAALNKLGDRFDKSIDKLTMRLGALLLLLILGVLALAGVQVRYGARPAPLDMAPVNVASPESGNEAGS